jgi:two-component sensor histidine kinase
MAGLDDLAKVFHQLEDFLVDEHLGQCDKTISNIARMTLDIESSEEEHEYNLREILLDQSESILKLNVHYSANINNVVDFDKAIALRKIVRELIKNSLSHSNQSADSLIIQISITDSDDKIKFEYYDNGNADLMANKDLKNKVLISGRGVGLKTIDSIADSFNSKVTYEKSERGYICFFTI